MDSVEILRQYNIGAMQSTSALRALTELLADVSTLPKLQEAARARYVIGFIRRVNQYDAGNASAQDLCLNIRDLILIMGRIKLSGELYQAVKKHGKPFDLLCEEDGSVSCTMNIPTWIDHNQYLIDVYALKPTEVLNQSDSSAGDELLRNTTIYTHYKNFEQKIAVQTALKLPDGYTLLVSQPTGGGKSLVTQMMSGCSHGLTIVIVPTVALALDQYSSAMSNLRVTNGIYCYRGDQTDLERNTIVNAIKNQSARLLFTSPEAIIKNQVLSKELENAAESQYLTNIVIDEAHVVPDWGVFFRPDFQIFSILLKKWKKLSETTIRTILLSATLADDVVDTLFSLFGSEGKNVQVRCDALRQEPRFYYRSVKSKEEQTQKTIEAMKALPKPMVIYVLEPREAKELQKALKNEGYLNIPIFTGDTKDDERDRILSGWKRNEYDVVVATSAFGIGVDKPDVRSIIHACCPENLSRYYQEVGRGGRDGLPSISLLMPYQSQHDKSADVRRALGLVNKRVLTVERSVIRWNSMLSSPYTLIDGDECVLDTSATPYTMTEEEVEFAGNRNVAWNINLLLFLYRTGFIDLLDVNFILQNKAYTVKVKLIELETLTNPDRLKEALAEPRQKEYDGQMQGYYIMRDLVASPTKVCWGRSFKHLFPLSREVCNGCPADPHGKVTSDAHYKLRIPPLLELPKGTVSRKIARSMGTFDEMTVHRPNRGQCTQAEIACISERLSANAIGCIVLPKRFVKNVVFSGIVMSYDEFYFAVENTPYLFADGVCCILEDDANSNLTIYKYLKKLDALEYKKILYCNEDTVVTPDGKPLRNCTDGYIVPIDKL